MECRLPGFLGSSKSLLLQAPLCTQICGSEMFLKFVLQSTSCFGGSLGPYTGFASYFMTCFGRDSDDS